MTVAEIITIGEELLIGQVVDTNSAWISQQLNAIGIKVKQHSSVSDQAEHIIKALDEASSRADLIIMTGGLGPTRDDITKKTLCAYFNTGLKLHEPSLKIIESLFKARGREVTPINRQQAEVPESCTVLLNHLGTAPGMWFEKDKRIFVSLPGIPAEMKGLFLKSVIPGLKESFRLTPICHRTVLTQGIGESFLADKISSWEDHLPAHMSLAYLPAAGTVRLRVSASGTDSDKLNKEVDEQVEKLKAIIHEYIYGYEEDKLEAIIGRLLLSEKKTVSTAESCTGGFIAHRLTSVPGSSEYYVGSLVAYSNEVKVKELGVRMTDLEDYGAVSEQVVISMARHALSKFKTDYAIACSGIAGPDGGTKDKPVGTVWIAIASTDKVITRKLQLGSFRMNVIQETSNHSLNTLRKMLIGEI